MIGKWNLKKILKEVVMMGSILFILTNIISYIRKPTLDNNQIPTQTFTLIDGTTYSLKIGKPLLIHFWATWCPTCKLEAANIQSIAKEYEVLTIAVNSGENSKIKAYMKEKDLHFPVVNDSNGKWAQQFHVEAYPTTFIYDGKGALKFTEVGYTTTVGLMARLKLSGK